MIKNIIVNNYTTRLTWFTADILYIGLLRENTFWKTTASNRQQTEWKQCGEVLYAAATS